MTTIGLFLAVHHTANAQSLLPVAKAQYFVCFDPSPAGFFCNKFELNL